MGKGPSPQSTGTPALRLLAQQGVPYSVHTFEHDPRVGDFGKEAARALGVDPRIVFKTLVWQVDAAMCVAIVPVTDTVAPKKLAKCLGARRAQMASPEQAERLSGSVVGAISPLGLRQTVAVVLDDSALSHDRIMISAGRRGMEIEMAPQDLARVTSAHVASITSDRMT